MSPASRVPSAVRPSAVVNAEIRDLWLDPRVQLDGPQRAEYERLLAEWEAAVRAEVVETA